jgi:membrane-bound lytic murein transglycosylase A
VPTPGPAPAPAPECRCEQPTPKQALNLTPARFADLPGWGSDALAEALPALLASCQALLAQPDDKPVGPGGMAGTVADWRPACDALTALPPDEAVLAPALESWFRPFLASDAAKSGEAASQGTITGYYEPLVTGSLTRQGSYVWPLYRPPGDLVTVKLGRFRADLEGQTLFGLVKGGELLPYHDRAAIDEAHVLSGQGLELAFLDDYVQLFFLQVQGSGQILLPDGRRLRAAYAANNGQPFTAAGRVLKEAGKLGPGQSSAQGVMAWLRAHPAEAWEVMKQNRRYVFFRLEEATGGPKGAQGVALTAGRSLAVDTRFLPLGAPLWLDTTWPAGSPAAGRPLRRLMVAQDTGGAIQGPVRGDFFWGAGEEALALAGGMQQPGRYWLLLPASVAERLPRQ